MSETLSGRAAMLEISNDLSVRKPGNDILSIGLYLEGCNLDCVYCRDKKRRRTPEKHTVEDIIAWISRTKQHYRTNETKCVIAIQGGEPLLQPEVVELVKHIPKDEYLVVIRSNGTLLTNDYAKKLYKSGLDNFEITLHTEESYETLGIIEETLPAKKIIINYILQQDYKEQMNNIISDINKYDMIDRKYILRFKSFLPLQGKIAKFSDADVEYIKNKLDAVGFHRYLCLLTMQGNKRLRFHHAYYDGKHTYRDFNKSAEDQ